MRFFKRAMCGAAILGASFLGGIVGSQFQSDADAARAVIKRRATLLTAKRIEADAFVLTSNHPTTGRRRTLAVWKRDERGNAILELGDVFSVVRVRASAMGQGSVTFPGNYVVTKPRTIRLGTKRGR